MLFRLPVYWYAFVDSSIEIVEFKINPVTSSIYSITKFNKLAVVGILLLNGFYTPTTHPNFYAEVNFHFLIRLLKQIKIHLQLICMSLDL